MGQFKNRIGKHIARRDYADHRDYREKRHKELFEMPRRLFDCNCCGASKDVVFDSYIINKNQKVSFCSKECADYYMAELFL